MCVSLLSQGNKHVGCWVHRSALPKTALLKATIISFNGCAGINDETTIHNVSFSVNLNILNALFLSIPRIHTFYQIINNLSFFPSVHFQWLPESPRYLVAVGEREKGLAELSRMARINKAKFPQGILKTETEVLLNISLLNHYGHYKLLCSR